MPDSEGEVMVVDH